MTEAIARAREDETLWQQLDKAIREVVSPRPVDSFTVAEFAERRGGINRNKAAKLIYKLLDANKIKVVGITGSGNAKLYQMVKP